MGIVDVKQTGEHELTLEWESSASNDMVADSTLALITGIDKSPASVKREHIPFEPFFIPPVPSHGPAYVPNLYSHNSCGVWISGFLHRNDEIPECWRLTILACNRPVLFNHYLRLQ